MPSERRLNGLWGSPLSFRFLGAMVAVFGVVGCDGGGLASA